jgi:hypothetical protein
MRIHFLISCILLTTVFGFNILWAADYMSPNDFETESSKYKMVVFLSEKCPCSKSHIQHVKDLMKTYPELKVYGVISEPAQTTREQISKDSYFKNNDFGFPVIQDPKQFLVKKYQALKTPHVVLLAKGDAGGYKVVYQGGLTDGKTYSDKSQKYLEEAMFQLSKNQEIKNKTGFCLGCYIRRF